MNRRTVAALLGLLLATVALATAGVVLMLARAEGAPVTPVDACVKALNASEQLAQLHTEAADADAQWEAAHDREDWDRSDVESARYFRAMSHIATLAPKYAAAAEACRAGS